MKFNTTEYEWVHGGKPRGFGLWWFSSEGSQYCLPFTFEHTGLYGEAKKAAAKEFKRYRERFNLQGAEDRHLKVNA